MLNRTQLTQVAEAYSISCKKLLGVAKGYRNTAHFFEGFDGKKYNLIVYKAEPNISQTIARANQFGDSLAALGFPARHTADPRIITLRNNRTVLHASLYQYQTGTTIPWNGFTQKHLKNLGKTMSELHFLSPKNNDLLMPSALEVNQSYLEAIKKYFNQTGVNSALQKKLGLRVNLSELTTILPYLLLKTEALQKNQLLHMDFVRGNILFETEESPTITGIIDFEKATFGHPIFDIARTLAFLYVDCTQKEPEKIEKYFLHSGYNKKGTSKFQPIFYTRSGIKSNLLDTLVRFYLVYDFYKFLKHTPYEDLPKNQHFVKTIQLLEKKEIICQAAGKKDLLPKVI